MGKRVVYHSVVENDEQEIEVGVSFTVAWGSPETGRGYLADPALYDPGSADEIEEFRLDTVDGLPRPWRLEWAWQSDKELEEFVRKSLMASDEDQMLDAAREQRR